MAIKMNQGLHLKQTQSLMMTPQLQQAIKLLTLTHLEMTNLIASEMVENPMLEESGNQVDDEYGEVDYKLEKLEMQNTEAGSDNFNQPDVVDNKEDFDWNSYVENFNSTSSQMPQSMATYSGEEIPNYENIVSQGMGLAEHLEWQLRMEELGQDEWQVLRMIVHNIDEEGYLDISIDEIIEETGHDREDTLELLSMVQNLDPVGCGARNLSECLLVQAKLIEPRMPLVERIIMDHINDLQNHEYDKIAKEIGVSREKIKDAEYVILSLNPKPGRLVGGEDTHYIVPDIYVKQMGNEFVVQLNDEGVPNLKVSNLYKAMLSSNGNKDAKEYVQDKLRAAVWLIKSIQNRQKTIVKVTEAIVRYQPDFFRKGAAFLRPMILKDIALEIGMHESTVSRVTTNKFVHTPLGTFELKYFFNSGIGGDKGGIDIASESLKLKIKELIDNEKPERPLSDQKIVDVLKNQDIVVARRTVAKYREMMNIQSSSKRKRKKIG